LLRIHVREKVGHKLYFIRLRGGSLDRFHASGKVLKISLQPTEPRAATPRREQCDESPEPWQEAQSKHDLETRKQLMNRRLMTTMVVASALLAGEAVYAAPPVPHLAVHAMFSNAGMVKLSLHNSTSEPITVEAGGEKMTLQPGQSMPVTLHSGDKIIADTASPTFVAGTVLAVVTSDLSGATILIK
jgi:hypothetical protein